MQRTRSSLGQLYRPPRVRQTNQVHRRFAMLISLSHTVSLEGDHRRSISHSHFVAMLQSPPERIPTMTEDHGFRYPDEGVAATSPAIVPEQNPTILHLRSIRKSSTHQTIPPKAAASIVFHMAKMARRFAPKALPPLKPSQPNQSMNASKYCGV